MTEEHEFLIEVDKGSDIFDKLAALFEKFTLDNPNLNNDIDKLFTSLLYLERTYQNINDLDRENTRTIIETLTYTLNIYYILISDIIIDYEFVNALNKQLIAFDILSTKCISILSSATIKNKFGILSKLGNYEHNISAIGSKQDLDDFTSTGKLLIKVNLKALYFNFQTDLIKSWKDASEEEVENVVNWSLRTDEHILIHNNYSSKNTFLTNPNKEQKYQLKNFEWTIEIKFNRTNNPTNISFVLWSISAALSQIEDVHIELSEWGMGSFWARIKIYMNDLLAKEKVKDIIERGANIAEAKLVEDKAANIGKIHAETEDLKRKLHITPNESESKEHRRIDLELKKEELRSKRLDNANKEFELIIKASNAMANGLILADDIQIDINGATYLLKSEQDKISITKPIDNFDTTSNADTVQ